MTSWRNEFFKKNNKGLGLNLWESILREGDMTDDDDIDIDHPRYNAKTHEIDPEITEEDECCDDDDDDDDDDDGENEMYESDDDDEYTDEECRQAADRQRGPDGYSPGDQYCETDKEGKKKPTKFQTDPTEKYLKKGNESVTNDSYASGEGKNDTYKKKGTKGGIRKDPPKPTK